MFQSRSANDLEDAQAQVKELESAQKIAEELIVTKDQELQDIRKKLADLQSQSEKERIADEEVRNLNVSTNEAYLYVL